MICKWSTWKGCKDTRLLRGAASAAHPFSYICIEAKRRGSAEVGGRLVGHLLLLINETELLPWVLLYKGWRWWKGLEEQYACQKWRLMVVPSFQKCRAGCTRQWRILELAANLALLLLTWHFQAHQAEYTKEKAKKNISSDCSTPKTLHKMGSPLHVRLIHHLFLHELKKKIISKKFFMCV